MQQQVSWHLVFAGALFAVSLLAAAFEPHPPMIVGLCLIAAVCFAVWTMRGDNS